jgi:hypothetical protein
MTTKNVIKIVLIIINSVCHSGSLMGNLIHGIASEIFMRHLHLALAMTS